MKPDHRKLPEKKEKKTASRARASWIILIFFITILISGTFSLIAQNLLAGAGAFAAFFVLFLIVLIGIVFDVIGVAVTAANAQPFHSMASRKIPEAQDALRLLRNADRVSSFCNDVVGDVCGIISGAAATIIAARIIMNFTPSAATIFQLILSALVAGLTVGGKAVGKTVALQRCTQIVHTVARAICFFRLIPARVGAVLHGRR